MVLNLVVPTKPRTYEPREICALAEIRRARHEAIRQIRRESLENVEFSIKGDTLTIIVDLK